MKVVEANIEIQTESEDLVTPFNDPDLLRGW